MIKYKEGYKYQLVEDYGLYVPILGYNVETRFIRLEPDGFMHFRQDYAWDGPSDPAIDTPDFMRSSLVHDGLYQLMRLRLIPADIFRPVADKLMREICIEDGMGKLRAWWCWRGVRFGGGPAATGPDSPILYAPTFCE